MNTPETVEELKVAITNLSLETGRGLWKTVAFEELSGSENNGWYASESGGDCREIIYCGINGLKNCWADLVEYKEAIDSGAIEKFRTCRGPSHSEQVIDTTQDEINKIGDID